jgi:hypothetical protein
MLLYLVLLFIAGSLFIAVNASPETNHLVNTGIGSRAIVVLSAITVMQGCKLHNGSMIAAALMATWYCLANTGNAASIGGGPTYWIDLLIPFELRMACLLMVMCLATLIKAKSEFRINRLNYGWNRPFCKLLSFAMQVAPWWLPRPRLARQCFFKRGFWLFVPRPGKPGPRPGEPARPTRPATGLVQRLHPNCPGLFIKCGKKHPATPS